VTVAGLSVLIYHDVVDSDPDESGFTGAGPARYKLARSAFTDHLDAIAAVTAAPPVSLAAPRANGASWALTFDDGGASALVVGELLAQRGWVAHFFVTTGRVGTRGFLDAAGVRALAEMGHVIGSHSHTHPARMSALPPQRLLAEWRESGERIADLVGAPALIGSVPGGYYAPAVARAAAAAGLRVLCTSEPRQELGTVDGCTVLGRYAVLNATPARTAAALAAGRRLPRWRRRGAWAARGVVKRAAGDAYPRVRARVLRAGSRSRRDRYAARPSDGRR
jgi:peptidoglycan/xylan/chitin deacetylase (PgdA/CDA1 family)